MKIVFYVLVTLVLSYTSATACTNMNRLPVFNYKKHASGDPDFAGPSSKNGRYIVISHSSGVSKIKITPKRGAKAQYTRTGTGEPLPVTVSVSEDLCEQGSKRLFTKKFHARLKEGYSTQFYAPFSASQNKAQAVALAQTVLQATYCPKSEIKLNPNHKYVDKTGSTPVVKTAAPVQFWEPNSTVLDDEWIIRLTCSEWRKVQ
ncbi:hypothetical protein [Ruegeria lacuscaerulensis]|uniref:hypothetical protein n=1 Tax=Ruegeria lacuscaerulensis TaxID=55218 RepID=UPI00147F7DE0|nr:hypothetical protein [Ruegeria lacuscaerulensis]